MAIDIKIITHNAYIEFTVAGFYNLNVAVIKFLHVTDFCQITEKTKVLIDFRKLKGKRGAIVKILYAYGVEDLYKKYIDSGGHELKVAYVGPSVSSFEPGLEIVKKGGLPFNLFDDREDALDWLDINGAS